MSDVEEKFREAFRREFSRRAALTLAGRGLVGAGMIAATLTGDGKLAQAAKARRGDPGPAAQGMQSAPPASQIIMGPLWTDGANWDQPEYYETIRLGDVDGDGYPELLARTANGVHTYKFDRKKPGGPFDASTGQWILINVSPILTDAGGWNHASYYDTMRLAEVNTDGKQELMVRGASGLLVYSFTDAGGWQPIGNVLSDLSDANLFGSPQYYETIHFGDIDGDGVDEMIARNKDGLQTYWFDGTNWNQIAPLFTDFSDGGSWNLPQYYRTIQIVQWQRNGPVYLLARYSDGLHVLQYQNPIKGWEDLYHVAGNTFGDKGWGRPEYYDTIDVQDVNNDGVAEVVGRDSGGMAWVKADAPGQTLVQSALMPDTGQWNQQPYYDTIRYGDIDGDGKLEIVYRGSGGVSASRWNAATKAFDLLPGLIPLSDGDGWGQVQYYSTILVEDVDGDGQAEVMVRGPMGIQTWRYDKVAQQWNTTTQGFPDFSSGDLNKSYQSVNLYLLNSSAKDIRSAYFLTSASDLFNYANALFKNALPTPTLPVGVDPTLFTAVVQQIQNELLAASNIHNYYNDSSQSVAAFIKAVYYDGGNLSLIGLAAMLEADKGTSSIWIVIVQAVVAAAAALATVVAPPAGAALFAGLFGAGAALLPLADNSSDGNGVQMAYGELETNLGIKLQKMADINAMIETTILQQYGLLMAHGSVLPDGGNFFDPDAYQALVDAATNGFLLWAWQQLTPYTWQLEYANGGSPPSDYTGPAGDITAGPYAGFDGWIGLQTGSASAHPANSIMAHLFNEPTDNPTGFGVSGQDVLNAAGPWYQIPYHFNPWVTQAPPIPAHRIVVRTLSLVRNVSGSVTVTLTTTNQGGNPETNVMVTGAQLNRVNSLHHLPTRHKPLRPGYGRTIILDFPASVGSKGTSVPLQITGRYKGGSFGGSLRVKLP